MTGWSRYRQTRERPSSFALLLTYLTLWFRDDHRRSRQSRPLYVLLPRSLYGPPFLVFSSLLTSCEVVQKTHVEWEDVVLHQDVWSLLSFRASHSTRLRCPIRTPFFIQHREGMWNVFLVEVFLIYEFTFLIRELWKSSVISSYRNTSILFSSTVHSVFFTNSFFTYINRCNFNF